MRFGVGMNTDHTLEEVGLQFSVTRERIRQIEAALRKLKHPSRSKQLKVSEADINWAVSPLVEYCIDIAGVVGAQPTRPPKISLIDNC